MYGAKQVGEIWGSLLDKALRQWAFTVSRYDERIYFFKQEADFIILAIEVDDLAFASNSTRLKTHLKQRMSASFYVKLFEKLTSVVGWNITQRDDGIKIDKCGYVKQILKDHGLHGTK